MISRLLSQIRLLPNLTKKSLATATLTSLLLLLLPLVLLLAAYFLQEPRPVYLICYDVGPHHGQMGCEPKGKSRARWSTLQHWAVQVGDHIYSLSEAGDEVKMTVTRSDSHWKQHDYPASTKIRGHTPLSDWQVSLQAHRIWHGLADAGPEYEVLANNCHCFAEIFTDWICNDTLEESKALTSVDFSDISKIVILAVAIVLGILTGTGLDMSSYHQLDWLVHKLARHFNIPSWRILWQRFRPGVVLPGDEFCPIPWHFTNQWMSIHKMSYGDHPGSKNIKDMLLELDKDLKAYL